MYMYIIIIANKDRYNSSSVFPSRFLFSFFFAKAHGGKNIFQKNKSYARIHWGMCLMHDVATSLTACQTVNLSHPNHRPKINLPYRTLIWDVLSCVVRRRYLANVIQFEHFICKGWVEGYSAAYLYAVRGCGV